MDIINKIIKLKEKKKAVILAHNYQLSEIQDIADFVGDSLELSRKASQTSAEIIVFCGVHFMAETASILCPDKKVLLPDLNAGCPLANMITPSNLVDMKKKYPDNMVVGYVNTSAAVKAEVDICCTSANAVKVAISLDSRPIIFVPDKHLANYVSYKTKKKLISWNGYCPTHLKILPEDLITLRKKYPDSKILVHPECRLDVIQLADEVLSTSGMVRYVKESSCKTFIIGTETGLIHKLKKENPLKEFIPASPLCLCPNMKLINLEKVLWSLEDEINEIKVPRDIRIRALNAVNRMIEIV